MNGGREGIVHENSQVLNNFYGPAIHADNPFCNTLAEKREDLFEDLAYHRPRHPFSEGANTTDHTSAVPVARTSVRSIKTMTPLGMGPNSSENTSQHRGLSKAEYYLKVAVVRLLQLKTQQ